MTLSALVTRLTISFVGGTGNDRLIGDFVVGFSADGRNNDDFLAARAPASGFANHKFTGGPGSDTFELPFYDNGRGIAIITDFSDGTDLLGVSSEFLDGRQLNAFLSNRVTVSQNATAGFSRTGEIFRGAGIVYNGNLVALVANTAPGLVNTFSDYVVTNSPFF